MKKHTLSLIFPLLFTLTATAQQSNVGCMDKAIRLEAENLKLTFSKQGMTVMRDAMISMESQKPASVMAQLTKGQMYQLIFVGSRASSKIQLELFDGEDHKIGDKKLTPTNEIDYIVYPFIPEKTDVYLIVLNQKQKHNEMCGSFTIMQQGAVIQQETPKPQPHSLPASPRPAPKR